MITIRDAVFHLEAEHVPAAFQALKQWATDVNQSEYKYWLPEAVHAAYDFERFLEVMGYGLVLDLETEDVTEIYTWDEIDYGGEEFMFASIAPFVTEGSYLDVEVDGDFYRWEFDGQYLLEFSGEVCYTTHTLIKPNGYEAYLDIDNLLLPVDGETGT